MKKITFIIFAFNEAHRIEYPIKTFLKFGDVLLVDNTSTDETVNIAKKLGAQVINRQKTNLECEVTESKEMADWVFKHVKSEWVYWGYADEMLTESCLFKYLDIIKSGKKKLIIQSYRTYLYGDRKAYIEQAFSYRAFKIGSLNFYPRNQSIHKIAEIDKNILSNEIEFLPIDTNFSIHHFSVYNSKKLSNNHNLYSEIHAKVDKGKYRNFNIILKPFSSFLVLYFLHKNFLNGLKGFIVAIQYSYYAFMVEAKKYENKNNITLITIERSFANYKAEILKDNYSKVSNSKFDIFLNKIKLLFLNKILIPIFLRRNKIK